MAVASPPPTAGRSHPTYKEMVLQALTELRESGGSSRDAISKYIADHFSGLPARHDDLLSVHLRRLSSQGLLLMTGFSSYLLPGADPGNPPRRGRGRPRKTAFALDQHRGPGRPRKMPDLSTPLNLLAAAAGVKRGPGRPRKNTAPLAAASGVKRGRGRPRKILTAPSESVLNIVTSVSVRRGRGRPRKLLLPAYSSFPTLVAGMRKRGRPPKNTRPQSVPSVALTARGPGRPREETSLGLGGGHLIAGVEAQPQAADQAADVGNGAEVSHLPPIATSSTEKRGRGRPRKRPLQTETTETALVEKRGRGRPRKKNPSALLSVETQGIAVSGYKRGRGRPRKRPLDTETIETALVVVEKTRPGSPTNYNPLAPLSLETQDVAMSNPLAPLSLETQDVAMSNPLAPLSLETQDVAMSNPLAPLSLETQDVAMSGYKRGRGRPRKRPLGTETTETALVEKRGPGRPRKNNPSAPLSVETQGVAMSGYKRGRGRPRKENPSAGTYAETGIVASIGIKRGRGRPRKDVSFGTQSVEAAVQVSRDLAESKPKTEDTAVPGNKTETESILSVAVIEVSPTNDGGALVSGENASTAHVEAEGATLGNDPVISNLDVDNRSL